MNSFTLAGAWLLVLGGILAASIAVADATERKPRRSGLFLRFIAATIESRQLQAQRVLDRYRPVGRGDNASPPQSDLVREQMIAVSRLFEQPFGPQRSNWPRPFAASQRTGSFTSADNGDCVTPIRRI